MGVASLFSGIGGIELGLRKHLPDLPLLLLCEINEDARKVLAAQFPDVPVHDDVCTLEALPVGTTVVTAGSPCTDLSSCGKKAGIRGPSSSLVDEVFRLVEGCGSVATIILENVVNLVRLNGGEGVRHVTSCLERLGFSWAYRALDAQAFGLPQSRKRILLVAQRGNRVPMWVFSSQPFAPPSDKSEDAFERAGFAGFYISEGKRGSSFRVGVIPTLKCNGNGGARIAYNAHPHCLILPAGTRADGARVVYLHIDDAERVQGFPIGWTAAAGGDIRRFARLGNAVPPVFAQFIGAGLAGQIPSDEPVTHTFPTAGPCPTAAYGGPTTIPIGLSLCATSPSAQVLTVLNIPPVLGLLSIASSKPVGHRAASGFVLRALGGGAAMPDWAICAIAEHAERTAP